MTVQSDLSAKTESNPISAESAESTLSASQHSSEEAHEHPHPRGTLMVALIFLVVLIAFWGYMYALLLLRGG